jgi:EmrB/QacA subfamily drug resistance transporter
MNFSSSAQTEISERASPAAPWLLSMLVVLIGAFMANLDTSIVNVAIAKIMNVFNTDTRTVQWVSTAYTLGMGVIIPFSGWLSDQIGLKNLYLISMVGFVVGSLVCAMSWNIDSLIAARALQALGGGMVGPTMMSMVYRIVPRDKIGTGMGILGISYLVAPAIGPTLGGYLVEYVDWRWIFTINLPIGLLGILFAFFIIPEIPKSTNVGKLDVGGFVTSSGGLSCLLLALTNGQDWGWIDERTVLLLFGAVALLGLFVYLELTTERPLLDIRMFCYRSFTLANIVMMCTTVGLFAGLFYVPLFLQNVCGLGAMEAGLLMMPGAVVSGLVVPIIGRICDWTGPKVILVVGLILLALTSYNFQFLSLDTAYTTICIWIVFRVFGIVTSTMPVNVAVMAEIPPELTNQASAMNNILRNVASSFGLAILTALLTVRTQMHAEHLTEAITPWSISLHETVLGYSRSLGIAGNDAMGKILGGLGLKIQQLAFVKGIDDIFTIVIILTVISILPALFLKKGKPGNGAHLNIE